MFIMVSIHSLLLRNVDHVLVSHLSLVTVPKESLQSGANALAAAQCLCFQAIKLSIRSTKVVSHFTVYLCQALEWLP